LNFNQNFNPEAQQIQLNKNQNFIQFTPNNPIDTKSQRKYGEKEKQLVDQNLTVGVRERERERERERKLDGGAMALGWVSG
jgi:hypothetical protein